MSRTFLKTVSFGTTNLIWKPTSFSASAGLGHIGMTLRCASTEPTQARTTRAARVVLYRIAKQPNAGHQRRARTAASDKPCMRGMLYARPLHAIVMRGLRFTAQ